MNRPDLFMFLIYGHDAPLPELLYLFLKHLAKKQTDAEQDDANAIKKTEEA